MYSHDTRDAYLLQMYLISLLATVPLSMEAEHCAPSASAYERRITCKTWKSVPTLQGQQLLWVVDWEAMCPSPAAMRPIDGLI